jgi:oligopeptide/dipeptide ABC transporter ATP-binding protein
LDPTAGQILYRHSGGVVDLAKLNRNQMRPLRKEMQIIFQDPFSSLNPRLTVMEIVTEPLRIQGELSKDELRARARELLEQVGLRVQHMNRYPYAFSGGQRQRIGIARALALKPRFIVCDEPVSALDVSIQAQVLNLLRDLQTSMGLTYLFISHDLSVVEHVSDRVAVMYLGGIVELAPSEELYARPRHPYTEALLSAVPSADPDVHARRIILPGDVPSPSNPPPGCKFHPRCRYAAPVCSAEAPTWREISPLHWVACHLTDQLNLAGIVAEE